MKNPFYYLGANPTVDLIVINPEGKFLVIKRSPDTNACPNEWAFPGGFIDTDAKRGERWKRGKETPESASVRELLEETNLPLKNPYLISLGIFEGNNRDPRDNKESWSKSYAFLHIIDPDVYEQHKMSIRGMDDAVDADWKTTEEIRELGLAFDHMKMLETALEILNKNTKKLKIA